jgi:transcriptional regulator with XRE-family HTH domain
MGSNEVSKSRFRKNLRDQRDSRNWSQAHLAKLLSARGLSVYATTIAKVEAGERGATIDEIVAVADVFGVSVDALVGRSSRRQRGDKNLPLHALAKRTAATAVAVEALEAGVREFLGELQEFTLRRDEASAAAECERAADALAEAAKVTRRAAAKLQRVQQQMQRDFLTDDTHNDEESGK